MRAAFAFTFALALASGCAVYDAPPEPSIATLDEGLLTDPDLLIVVASPPPVQRTLKLEIVRYGSSPAAGPPLGDGRFRQNTLSAPPPTPPQHAVLRPR